MEENEKGFIQIPRAIGNRLKKILPAEMGCYLHILDKTLSYGKEEDHISYGQLAKATGLSLRWVKMVMRNLETKRMIAIRRKLGRGHKNEPNTIRVESPDVWLVKEISDEYRKQLERRKNSHRKSRLKGSEGKRGSEGNLQKVVKETDKGGEGKPPIEYKEFNKEITKKEEEGKEFPSAPSFSSLTFKSENPNPETQEAEEPFIQEEPIQKDVSQCVPMYWEDQKQALQERKEKKHLSSSGSSGKDGPWSDEQLRAQYGDDADCKAIRQKFRETANHQELLNIQMRYMKNPSLVPRIQGGKE